MNIWWRLKTVLGLLLVLLLAGVALAIWVDATRLTVAERNAELSGTLERIRYHAMLITDSLRGLCLEPKNKAEEKRRGEAEKELKSDLQDTQRNFAEYPDLLDALRSLDDFIVGSSPSTLGHFQGRVLELAESDPANALTYYNANYPSLNRQRDLVFRELARQIDQVERAESVRTLRVTIIGLAGLGVILVACFMVGRFQSAAIAEPLNRLVGNLEQMRQGDFTQRLPANRRDEFGIVSQGLNRLADDLCELVGQVQRSGIQVNTTATQIAATAREQQSTAHEIAATTSQIGATSKEISATSKDLVKTMNEVNRVAEAAAKLAGSGHESIIRMESTMRQLMQASSSITAKLAVLSEKTTNINSVVTTITKVADQTNLLSLNAAIEAEKAGEYGLGFAVVAMEIRRLADQTAVATYDIEKMVREMHTAVAAGVVGMDRFTEDVRRGVEEVSQVSTHLAQILQQVQTLTPRFQIVNEGMHAQANGAQQISETLTQLSEAAQQTAESLWQSNLAIEQLNGAARGLQASIARFKLGNGNGSHVEPNGHSGFAMAQRAKFVN
jgi:methyl-accepting chemotaxis protein WspA